MQHQENLEKLIPRKYAPEERVVECDMCRPVILDVRELNQSHLDYEPNESLHLYHGDISPVAEHRSSSKW